MLKYQYEFYLPRFKADNHGYPTNVDTNDEVSKFLCALVTWAGGYTIIPNCMGECDMNGNVVKETVHIVRSTMHRDTFDRDIASFLRDFKYATNQTAVYVVVTPVEVCYA